MSMVPTEELPILESLVSLRTRLSLLKKDRTEYIRAKDVLDIYSSLLDQVNRLNEIRSPSTPKASTSAGNQLGDAAAAAHQQEQSSHQENRVDTILNDVFQLLSLFFLTIGKSREAPAAFCQLASIKRLLTHLNESGIYTESDLKPFHTRLQELKTVIESSQSSSQTDDQEPPLTPTSAEQHDAPLNKLLLTKWSDCDRLLQKLQSSLSRLSPELAPLHQRLITLRRLLASILARPKPSAADTAPILNELRAIEDKRVNGKFVVDGKEPELGQELCAGLLEDNFDIAQEIQAKEGEQEVQRGPLQPIYDRLSELRAQLERLVLTHRWTLRETDLYNYQMALQEIDRMRVDGKFRDSEGNTPKGQIVLLYLLRRCYGLCYRLMASSEPISEELMPIANKLTTIKRCLIEVQRYGGPYSARDLYPYYLALQQIDNLRTPDGKFVGRDGSVPEGQAILNALLSECHEIVSVMQEEGME